MKKQLIAAVVLLFSFTALAQTTPEKKDKKDKKVSIVINSKFGFAKLNQTDLVTLNGNINGGDFLFSYSIGKNWDLAAGVGFMDFNANPTIAGNSASLKNSYLQIPLKAFGDFSIFEKEQSPSKIAVVFAGGFYANTLLKSEVKTLSGNSSEKNLGWNFGVTTQLGAKFIVSDDLDFEIGLESQIDLSDMKHKGVNRKIEQLNVLYANLGFKF